RMSLALPSLGHQATRFGGGTVHVCPTASVAELSITPSRTRNQRGMTPRRNILMTLCVYFMLFSLDVWLETYVHWANVDCSRRALCRLLRGWHGVPWAPPGWPGHRRTRSTRARLGGRGAACTVGP